MPCRMVSIAWCMAHKWFLKWASQLQIIGENRVVFVLVFLTGIGVSVVIPLLPEILNIIPVEVGWGRVLLKGCASNRKHYGAGVLPWREHLEVVEGSGTEMLYPTDRSIKTPKDTERAGLESEAMASLRMAVEMRRNRKEEKALKLFQHAYALHPTHPDILNHYGRFLEEHTQDVVQAEHLYALALIHSPGNHEALINRQRTLPMVEELDMEQLDRIGEKRYELSSVPESDPALRRMKKEAYFQHIYHTVGLEGNTMTLAETRLIVETQLAVGGKSLLENNEILGLDEALTFINSSLVQKLGSLTVDDILAVHLRVMGHVSPSEAGRFRSTRVFVGEHVPAEPSKLPVLMSEFVDWLNSEEALDLHPVRFAALAHYRLVYIHPFADGNGRTSRLIMNLILMRAGYPPVIIRKQDRLHYYRFLETANEGDVRPFIRFIAECTERTLDVYLYAVKDHPVPAIESQKRQQRNKLIIW